MEFRTKMRQRQRRGGKTSGGQEKTGHSMGCTPDPKAEFGHASSPPSPPPTPPPSDSQAHVPLLSDSATSTSPTVSPSREVSPKKPAENSNGSPPSPESNDNT